MGIPHQGPERNSGHPSTHAVGADKNILRSAAASAAIFFFLDVSGFTWKCFSPSRKFVRSRCCIFSSCGVRKLLSATFQQGSFLPHLQQHRIIVCLTFSFNFCLWKFAANSHNLGTVTHAVCFQRIIFNTLF